MFSKRVTKACESLNWNFQGPDVSGDSVTYALSLDGFLAIYLVFRRPRTGDLIGEIALSPITVPDSRIMSGELTRSMRILDHKEHDPLVIAATAKNASELVPLLAELSTSLYGELKERKYPRTSDHFRRVQRLLAVPDFANEIDRLIMTSVTGRELEDAVWNLSQKIRDHDVLSADWNNMKLTVMRRWLSNMIWGYQFVDVLPKRVEEF